MLKRHTICVLSLAAVLPAAGGCGDGDGPSNPAPPVVAGVEITPPTGPLVSLGEVVNLTATVRDPGGVSLPNQAVSWTSLNPGIATADNAGRVVAQANGQAQITATVAAVADTVTIVVEQRAAIVRIIPAHPVLLMVGDQVAVSGTPVDALGNVVPGAPAVTWNASGAISVQPSGLVEATAFGNGTLVGTAGMAATSTTVEVIGDRYFLSHGERFRYDLDLPDNSGGPFPAVVWVHGSGQTTRHSQRDATDPLVPQGLAVLRYDKRGVGESGGTYQNVSASNSYVTLDLLADDAANAARHLARRPEIDPNRIGIMGNSQGGWIVPQAAHKASDIVEYIMLWSGPTVSVGLEIFYSSLAEGTTTPLDEVYAQLPANPSAFGGYDALADVSALTIPAMWQYGELDRSIPMRLDVDRLNALIAQGKPFEVITWEFGDHALRDTRINQFYDVWSEYTRFLRDRGFLP